jgi:mRNA interferase MazF
VRRGWPTRSPRTSADHLVVSSDDPLGLSVWQTHVVPVTSDLDRAVFAGNGLPSAMATELPKDSVAVPLGLELVDRALLGEEAGVLPSPIVDDIDEGLRAVLGL